MGRRFLVGVFLLLPALAQAQTGTIMPPPIFRGTDANNAPLASGKLCVYVAGSTTPATTYADVALTVPNTNPIILNGAGLAGPIFLAPGTSYKFLLKSAGSDATCSTGTTQWTRDNIASVPANSGNLDVVGTAGEAISAGQVVYLSDGSGSKTAGQWFKADSSNPYSSTSPIVGMAPAAIASGVAGSIRLGGQQTGLSSLTVGSTYYVSTAGTTTATAPANARALGTADSTSSLILAPNPAPPVFDNGVNDFRLTLTSGTPITSTDVTAATTLYLAPLTGNRIALFDASGVPTTYTSGQVSIAVPATTSQLYDVFAYASSGTVTLELLAWTNDTTRATALVNTVAVGVYTKSGDATRRYLGSVRTTGVSGQTEDSAAVRYLWNYYHRAIRPVKRFETTASWVYSSGTWRQARATAANQISVIQGLAETPITLSLFVRATCDDAAGGTVYAAIGADSTSVPSVLGPIIQGNTGVSSALLGGNFALTFTTIPAIGKHDYVWLERSPTAVTTWYGLSGTDYQYGLSGTWEN